MFDKQLYLNNRSIHKWERLIPQLWCEVSEVLKLCLRNLENNGGRLTISTDDNEILNLYRGREYLKSKVLIHPQSEIEIPNPYLPYNSKTDHHLREGLFEETHWNRKARYPRLAELTINACKIASSLHSHRVIVIPSPLHIIYTFLSDPDNSCTAAYALTACRNWLSGVLSVWPVIDQHDKKEDVGSFEAFLTELELHSSMESFSNYDQIGARWPDKPLSEKSAKSTNSLKRVFVGSYLAVRGFTLLWFSRRKNRNSIEYFCELLPGREQYDQAQIMAASLLKGALFTLSPAYAHLPPREEISNQLFGFPLPIRGMDVVFNGGLRPSSSGGLVMVVSGEPGAGKTSFSLALANALLPFGTPTYYISLEETVSDIQHKLDSIRPDFEKRLCITQDNNHLFNCIHIPAFSMLFGEFAENMKEILNGINEHMDYDPSQPVIAGTCPGIIVIDNLNILNEGHNNTGLSTIDHLEEIVAECRKANILTIFITAQDLLSKFRLDYLADFVVDLRYEKMKDINDRPLRIFNLLKTRHQLARQGAHVFHLGSGKGFRIVPNMDSLMDRRRNVRLRLPDSERIVHALNIGRTERRHLLDIFDGSNILVHGYGSSGKAGLALRLLLTPPVPKKLDLDKIKHEKFSSIDFRRKVLVISFLYPRKYYDELIDGKPDKFVGLHEQISGTYSGMPKPILEDLVLYPGFIGAQDFLNKVVMKLDRANLSGDPFTGILIDGLHNVFLQYPRLQDTDMVWAILYNILMRYPISVVSTFTNFSVNENIIPSLTVDTVGVARNPDEMLMQKGMTPFLHALIKATDFYLVLQELSKPDNSKIYPLSIRSAIGQSVPDKIAMWDREKIQIDKYTSTFELSQEFSESNSKAAR